MKIQAGSHTLIVSSFEPSQTGKYDLSIECDQPISIRTIPQEGAGMFSRTVSRTWSVPGPGVGPPNVDDAIGMRQAQVADPVLAPMIAIPESR